MTEAVRKLAYNWVAEKIARALNLQSDTLPDPEVRGEVEKILKAFEGAAAIPPLDTHGKNGHPP